jgi:cytochrome c biogenesis protein CcmG/thiol:disulfide interchange protein DsbE
MTAHPLSRWLLIATPFLLAGGLVTSTAVRDRPEVSDAPSFQPRPSTKGVDLRGRTITLGSMRGTPLTVIFFASWCGPCHEEAQIFTRLAERYGRRVGFVSVAVDEGSDQARAFAARYAWTWSVIPDDRRVWVDAFGPPGLPATFLLDADGEVRHTLFGPLTQGRLTSRLEALLAEAERS